MKPKVSLREALADENLLGAALKGDSWRAWRVLLMATMGEPLRAEELDLFRTLTGRLEPPSEPVDEFWGVVGRRGGKSKAESTLALYIAGLCDHTDVLSAGERGVVTLIAPDQRQSRILLDYAEGGLRSSKVLAKLLSNRIQDTLSLTTGIDLEVRSASFRRIRGATNVAVIADEAPYWFSDESANPDTEILNAVRPSLATTRGPLIVIGSPYARKGEVWNTYSRHYGAKGDPKILVAHGTSRDFNPSLPQVVIDRAMERDPAAASAEYLAQFRTDREGFITLEAVQACIERGITERRPNRMHRYFGFSDPSGGVSDSFVTSVAHQEGEYGSETIVLDAILETRAPFAPEATVAQHAEMLKRYRVGKCFGDRYGSGWVVEQWKKNDINYAPSEKNKSELYLDFLPLVMSRAVDLLDNDRMVHQLTALERRTGRGRDIVDHREDHRSHDDVANSVAGAIVHASLNRYSSQSFFPAGKPKLQHPGFADPLERYRIGGSAPRFQSSDGLRR